MTTEPMIVVRVPPELRHAGCGGVWWQTSLAISRLEHGLGHEAYRCEKCGERIKYVPLEKDARHGD